MDNDVINSFSELSADQYAHIYCLVMSSVEKTGANGKPYLDVKLSDGSTNVAAKVWNTTLDDSPVKEGHVIYARIATSIYGGRLQYVVTRAEERPNMKPDMFLTSAPIDSDEVFKSMKERVSRMREPLRTLVTALLNDNEDAFKHAAGGKTLHHGYIGGLLYHSYRMTQSAEALSRIYKDIDADLLVAGTMLHDIGKTKELDTDWKGNVVYTVPGAMFGHLFFGTKMVMDKAEELGVADSEDAMLLAHIIACHHGESVNGAIKQPLTREAMLVHQLDMIDMYQTVFDENLEAVAEEPGTITPKFTMFDYGAYYPKRLGKQEEREINQD